jgi:hypothetical protein
MGLLVVVGLPLAGHWARRHAAEGCALDGMRIDPAYRVEVVDARGYPHAFCCIRCGQRWLKNEPPPRAITVTDEASGQAIAADKAWYVASSVVTMPVTGNKVHTFRERADAERHAEQFWGAILPDAEKPFGPTTER